MPRKASTPPALAASPAAAISEGGILAHDFAGPSWNRWRAVLRAAYAEPMTADERVLFGEVAERDPPAQRVRELWVVAGRRAGKDSIAAAIAVCAAIEDYRPCLRTGERATVMCLATDRAQARIVHRYIAGYFETLPLLRPLVRHMGDEVVELHNNVDILVATNSFRAVRGRTVAAAILDEVAYWRSDDAAVPDNEVYAAIEPAMLTIPNAMLIGISSPFARKGLLFEKWRQHYGRADDDVLVVRGPSVVFNPTLPQRIIDARLEQDPEAGAAEYLAEWRSDIGDFLDRALIEAAVERGVAVRPPCPGGEYTAFADPSGGRGSSFAVAIAHYEDNVVMLDAVHECRAPFDPDVAVGEVCALLRSYGVGSVTGDRYAGAWVSEAFAARGIRYGASDRDKSAIYLDSLPLLTAGRLRLLDHPRLVHQFAHLERRVTKFGRDRVGPPIEGADDISNAVAGACVNALVERPALVKQASVLGAPVPLPGWATVVMSAMAVGSDGMVGTVYCAEHDEPRADPANMVLLDATLEPLSASTIHCMAERLQQLREQIPNPRSLIRMAWVPRSLEAQARVEGYAVEVYPEAAVRDLASLAVTFASHVNAGRFRVCETVVEKARMLPLAAALTFRPGERLEDNTLRLAILHAAAVGLRQS